MSDIEKYRTAILSVTYGTLSVAQVFTNKLAMSIVGIGPIQLLLVQCVVSSGILFMLRVALHFTIQISASDLFRCIFVNFAFIGVMVSNAYTLKYLSVSMVTLLKCFSVVITALGDVIFLQQKLTPLVWLALFLIVLGSVLGIVTDLEFNMAGYVWMTVSIMFSAFYVLISKSFVSSRNLHFLTAAFWNNLLGSVFLSAYNVFSAESLVGYLTNDTSHSVFLVFTGVLGLLLNISTYSLLGATSATSYVVVGAGKKIVQAFLSFIFMPNQRNINNIMSVFVGLFGACIYAYTQWKTSRAKAHSNDEEQLIASNEDHEDELAV